MMQHDWLLTAFVCVFVLSLTANFVGLSWSIYRELGYRQMSDTLLRVADNAGKTLAEIQSGMSTLCRRIEEDRTLRLDAKRELSDEVKRTGQHITTMLSMLASIIKGSNGSINIKGTAQFNEGDGEQNEQ